MSSSTSQSGRNDTASVTRTQLSFLISSLSEDSYDKSVTELRAVRLSDFDSFPFIPSRSGARGSS